MLGPENLSDIQTTSTAHATEERINIDAPNKHLASLPIEIQNHQLTLQVVKKEINAGKKDVRDTGTQKRIVYAIEIVGSDARHSSKSLGLVPAPSKVSGYSIGNDDLGKHLATLNYFANVSTKEQRDETQTFSRTLPDAAQKVTYEQGKHTGEIVETGFGGFSFGEILSLIHTSYADGRISVSERDTMITVLGTLGMYELQIFHKHGYVHSHLHPNNIRINPFSETLHIVDYTAPTTLPFPINVFPRSYKQTLDKATFLQSIHKWFPDYKIKNLIQSHTLSYNQVHDVMEHVRDLMIIDTLTQLGIDHPTSNDIQIILEAREQIISEAPTIVYPKENQVKEQE